MLKLQFRSSWAFLLIWICFFHQSIALQIPTFTISLVFLLHYSWLIYFNDISTYGYFIPRGYGILSYSSCFKRVFSHTVVWFRGFLSNTNNLYTIILFQLSIFNIGMMVRVFANRLGDLGSIPGRVIPKTQKKWYLMPPCLTLSIIR